MRNWLIFFRYKDGEHWQRGQSQVVGEDLFKVRDKVYEQAQTKKLTQFEITGAVETKPIDL